MQKEMNMKRNYSMEDLQPIDQIRLLQAHGSNGTPHGRFEMWLAKKDEFHDKFLDIMLEHAKNDPTMDTIFPIKKGGIEVAKKKAKKKKGKKRGRTKEESAEETTIRHALICFMKYPT